VPVKSWQETDLMERPVGESSSDAIELTVTPYEIKTVRLQLK
jgi:alpha-mannosidase